MVFDPSNRGYEYVEDLPSDTYKYTFGACSGRNVSVTAECKLVKMIEEKRFQAVSSTWPTTRNFFEREITR